MIETFRLTAYALMALVGLVGMCITLEIFRDAKSKQEVAALIIEFAICLALIAPISVVIYKDILK
jgi:hypothetical protein